MNEKEIIELVSSILGIQGVTKDNLKQELESFVNKSKVMVDPNSLEIGEIKGWDKVKAEFQKNLEEVESLRPLKEKEAFIKAGETHLAEVKEEAVKFYKLTLKEGVQEDENIINLINGSNLEQVVALKKQYEDAANEKAPLTCSKCGSHEVTRASSSKSTESKEKEDNVKMTYDEIRERMIDNTYLGLDK